MEFIMKNIVEVLHKQYNTTGENGEHLQYFKNAQEVLNQYDVETFEDKFLNDKRKAQSFVEINFPIITFDRVSDVDGHLFTENDTKDDIIEEAEKYFKKKQISE